MANIQALRDQIAILSTLIEEESNPTHKTDAEIASDLKDLLSRTYIITTRGRNPQTVTYPILMGLYPGYTALKDPAFQEVTTYTITRTRDRESPSFLTPSPYLSSLLKQGLLPTILDVAGISPTWDHNGPYQSAVRRFISDGRIVASIVENPPTRRTYHLHTFGLELGVAPSMFDAQQAVDKAIVEYFLQQVGLGSAWARSYLGEEATDD